MAESKVEFSVGAISFSGEGNEHWLAEQLDKVIAAAPALAAHGAPKSTSGGNLIADAGSDDTFQSTLATYLKTKNAEKSQPLKFLATADWLRLRGAKSIKTSDVTKALSDNHQGRLGNASDCLNKNVAKGFCEKSADGFY